MSPTTADIQYATPLTRAAAAPKKWQQHMLARVAWGMAVAFALTAMLTLVGAPQGARYASSVSGACALLMVGVAITPRSYYLSRATALFSIGTLTAVALQVLLDGVPTAAHLLAIILVLLSGLLLDRRLGYFVTAAYTILSLLAVGLSDPTGSVELSQQSQKVLALGQLGIFLALALVCLWWVGYGVSRIQKAVTLRDDLLNLVREETEERISQLEKQQSLERQLRQSQKMEALGTLAGGIAHDFNNLLLVIVSGAQSARHTNLDELEEILAEITDAAHRGSALTQQLLAFGRRKINERRPVQINAEIHQSLQLIGRLIPSNVHLNYSPSEHVKAIEASSVDIDQIMMNLCINARDAMPSGGTLKVETSLYVAPGHRQEEILITVKDDGTGMTDTQLDRVFEPFFTTKRTGAGTGLGLSVVHTIVNNHKGRIEVNSKKGEGTEFRVYFPHLDHNVSIAPDPALKTHAVAHERILLVDDDAAVRKGVARILKRTGYEVVLASDGEEALKIYQNSEDAIALVITDAIMPNMGGRDLCEAVTALKPDQPCLICSGYDAGTLDGEFFSEHGREFLAKPFENEQLLSRVRALLELKRLTEQTPIGLGKPPSVEDTLYR